MRKSLIIASALMAAASAPALAADGTVDITGVVADSCQFTGDTTKTIDLGDIADSDGKLDASAVNSKSATLTGWCNGTAATMTVSAAPLDNEDHLTAAPGAFDTRVNYTATAEANSKSASDSTTADPSAAAAVGLFSGDVKVTLSDASTPGSGLLVAGDYKGSVQVTLTPNTSFNLPEAPVEE